MVKVTNDKATIQNTQNNWDLSFLSGGLGARIWSTFCKYEVRTLHVKGKEQR